jgi:hypothetical protein
MPFLATSLRSSAKFDAGPKRGDVGMDEFPDLVDLIAFGVLCAQAVFWTVRAAGSRGAIMLSPTN